MLCPFRSSTPWGATVTGASASRGVTTPRETLARPRRPTLPQRGANSRRQAPRARGCRHTRICSHRCRHRCGTVLSHRGGRPPGHGSSARPPLLPGPPLRCPVSGGRAHPPRPRCHPGLLAARTPLVIPLSNFPPTDTPSSPPLQKPRAESLHLLRQS